ncbi:MAG: PleD family two-component system response regulator [Gemmataceae bacterium]
MRVLVAEDSYASRCRLEEMLADWGYQVLTADNGADAWSILENSPPQMALLDWMMPEIDGVEICRRVRNDPRLQFLYILLLTARVDQEDVVAGLEAGADDYLTKPVNPSELKARLNVGRRIIELQQSLGDRVHELELAMSSVHQLQGLLPICSYCKKIRDDKNYWQQVESYITSHSGVQFSHGICPDCYERLVKKEANKTEESDPRPSDPRP